MSKIEISVQQNAELQVLVANGKSPWLLIGETSVVDVFPNRDGARTFKAMLGSGKVCKASEIELVVKSEEVPAKAAKAAKVSNDDLLHESSIERPCKRVWVIADEMTKANPNVRRRDILAACVEAGIAYYTARTQYQQYLSVQKEEKAREAANGK